MVLEAIAKAVEEAGAGLSGRLLQIDEYRRQKQSLEDKLMSLVVHGVDAAKEAGKLLGGFPGLWEQANLVERRQQLLLTILDAVYVDARKEKAIIAIRPKPAFKALFEIATTRKGSGIVLITTTPPDFFSPEASTLCSWWRRGRVELPQERGLPVLLLAA